MTLKKVTGFPSLENVSESDKQIDILAEPCTLHAFYFIIYRTQFNLRLGLFLFFYCLKKIVLIRRQQNILTSYYLRLGNDV